MKSYRLCQDFCFYDPLVRNTITQPAPMVAEFVRWFQLRSRKSGVPVVLTQATVRKKQGSCCALHLAFYSLCWSVFLVTGVPMLFLNAFDSLRQEGKKDHYTPYFSAALRPQPGRNGHEGE